MFCLLFFFNSVLYRLAFCVVYKNPLEKIIAVWFIFWDELRMWLPIHLLPQSKYFPVKYFVVIKFLTNSDINLVSGKNINKTGYKAKCQRQSAWGRGSVHTHIHTQCVAVTEFSMPEARERENRCEATSCSQEGCLASQRRLVCFLWSPND